MQTDTPTASSQNSSTEIEGLVKTLGDPNCLQCKGAGYVRFDVPVGHEKFGKLESCVCRAKDVAVILRNTIADGCGHLICGLAWRGSAYVTFAQERHRADNDVREFE